MPTYLVRTANIDLSDAQRREIAAAITQAHSGNTGAPGYFAQVIFDPIAPGVHFIGGQPNAVAHLFVHGWIRAGRTAAQKSGLIDEITRVVREAAGVGPEDVWVYVQDIAPEQMVEFGRTLPQPGQEAEWQRGFSDNKLSDFRLAGVEA